MKKLLLELEWDENEGSEVVQRLNDKNFKIIANSTSLKYRIVKEKDATPSLTSLFKEDK
jgi:predicted mannosyl-3-phosphoglycerate phosphatase (HAD superfamily)